METLLETEKLVARPHFADHYDNFIGGEWKSPVKGEYFASISPIDGQAFTKVPRSGKEDIEQALVRMPRDANQPARKFGQLFQGCRAFAFLRAQLHASDQAAEILIALTRFGK